MSAEEIDAWAHAYIACQQSPDHLNDDYPLAWTFFQFMVGSPDAADPEDCWLAILAILDRCPAAVLGTLAAGPLEDLIDECGAQFIERIELQARRDPKFRDLLRSVCESSSPDIWDRVVTAQA